MAKVNITSLQTKNLANRDEIFLLVFVFDDMMTTTIMLFPIYMEGGKYQLRGSAYMILLSPKSTTPFHLQKNIRNKFPPFFLPCWEFLHKPFTFPFERAFLQTMNNKH